jgi:hypothetical protein
MVSLNWAMSEVGQQSFRDIVGSSAVPPGIKPPKLEPDVQEIAIVLGTDLLKAQNQKAIIDEWWSEFGLQ